MAGDAESTPAPEAIAEESLLASPLQRTLGAADCHYHRAESFESLHRRTDLRTIMPGVDDRASGLGALRGVGPSTGAARGTPLAAKSWRDSACFVLSTEDELPACSLAKRAARPTMGVRGNAMEGLDVVNMLEAARHGESTPLGQLLRSYQNYLTILASAQLDKRLHRRVSPSDLVQETMLAAHRDFPQFRGRSEPEFLAWLRQVFLSCLRHSIDEHVRAKKRDIRCEISIDQTIERLDQSAVCLARQLADRGPTPSAVAGSRERAVALADQLAQLKPEYRDVIVLRNLQGLKFDEIAERMDRKPGTVRMLWLRAMDKLRQLAPPVDS